MRSWLYCIVFVTALGTVMLWLIPHLLDLARGPVLHWSLPVRAALCLGAIGVVTLLCHARARPLIASMLLARFAVSMGCTLGVSGPLIFGVAMVLTTFGILHVRLYMPT